jgi:transposase InsO family protein
MMGVAADLLRPKAQLLAENALLRQQLIVLKRSVKRPRLRRRDRIVVVALSRLNSAWKDALVIVQPDTLLRWHRQMFKLVWWRKSRPKTRRLRVALDAIALIRRIARANLLWGAERIRGELLKLGIKVSKRTIQKYAKKSHRPSPKGQNWETFLKNHAHDIWACDFLQVYDLFFRPIFLFFIIEHGSRRVVHAAATRSPTEGWVTQQLREATPFGEGPKYIIRDNDRKFGQRHTGQFDRLATGSGIEVLHTPPKSPLCNAFCERFLGSVRRECLDHILILSEDHLRRVVLEYVRYFNGSRPHQGIGQKVPRPMKVLGKQGNGEVVESSILGGLHHEYRRAA